MGQLALNPVESTEGQRNVRGVAVIAQRGGQRQLIVQAQLPRNKEGQAYQVWLYNSDGDARSLGAQVADRNGAFQGAGPLPEGFERYRFIDVSREDIRGDEGHGGDSVLRGRLDQIQPAARTPPGRATPGRSGTQTTRAADHPAGARRALALGSSFPGFITPDGSRRSFAARSASIPSAPTSASIHGAWSVPTAWWWVIVPPGGYDRVTGRGLGRAPLVQLGAAAPGGRGR